MEREFSAQNLLSRGGSSEMGSRYTVESGFYMTSFAATIFIGGLISVGVIFITLLVALTVMLQSCQSRSSGVVKLQLPTETYNFCRIFAQHSEISNMEPDEFPSVCRDLAIEYIKEGKYARDLNISMWLTESYFSSITPLEDGLDVVLMDIDDILASKFQFTNLVMKQRYDQHGCSDYIEEAKRLMHVLTLKLYTRLHGSGWSLILLSRKPERQRNATTEHLISAGYSDWSSLIMRLDTEMQMNSQDYFSKRGAALQKGGFRINGVISSQMDAFMGPSLGECMFKLPNPTYQCLGIGFFCSNDPNNGPDK
ncbi:Acid_phosphat_B domain-containing protein [Cephalotus follicularis]|uniref:Acid_phosphat_B domain-containing protein n=1 Tax=Cephalotus follicularis TaxID=3775 RepID=A0A1Q3AM28_CEPFO|nr:Acid_phosphat_B domain-containing protein [Cephalotus follicularis]